MINSFLLLNICNFYRVIMHEVRNGMWNVSPIALGLAVHLNECVASQSCGWHSHRYVQ